MERTKTNHISLEAFLVNFVAVELNEGPVLRVAFVARTDRNRRGRDMSQDTLADWLPELRGRTVELVQRHLVGYDWDIDNSGGLDVTESPTLDRNPQPVRIIGSAKLKIVEISRRGGTCMHRIGQYPLN